MARGKKVKPTIEQVKDAVRTILSDTASYAKSLNWAVNYCRYALQIDSEEEMDVQVRYILNNISHWRHADAKAVRETLKAYIK
ncbi:MAG: hypothetical protein ACWGQW_03105 [bacterium]